MSPVKKGRSDIFANIARAGVILSAADTLTFNQLQTGVAMFEKMAWVIHTIEFFISIATLELMTASTDNVIMALTSSDQITSLGTNRSAVLDLLQFNKHLVGTVVSEMFSAWPLVHDFSKLPGGGLIIVPSPLYAAAVSTGLGTAASVSMRIRFTYRTLRPEEYWELVESTRIIT